MLFISPAADEDLICDGCGCMCSLSLHCAPCNYARCGACIRSDLGYGDDGGDGGASSVASSQGQDAILECSGLEEVHDCAILARRQQDSDGMASGVASPQGQDAIVDCPYGLLSPVFEDADEYVSGQGGGEDDDRSSCSSVSLGGFWVEFDAAEAIVPHWDWTSWHQLMDIKHDYFELCKSVGISAEVVRDSARRVSMFVASLVVHNQEKEQEPSPETAVEPQACGRAEAGEAAAKRDEDEAFFPFLRRGSLARVAAGRFSQGDYMAIIRLLDRIEGQIAQKIQNKEYGDIFGGDCAKVVAMEGCADEVLFRELLAFALS